MEKRILNIIEPKKCLIVFLAFLLILGAIPLSNLFAYTDSGLQDPLAGNSIETRRGDHPKGSDGETYKFYEHKLFYFEPSGKLSIGGMGTYDHNVLLGKDTNGNEQWLYCIEHGVPYSVGEGYGESAGGNASYLTQTLVYGINNIAKQYNIAGLNGQKTLKSMLIVTMYGWQPNMPMPAELKGLNNWDWFMATQVLLWEFQQGTRQSFTQRNGNGIAAADAEFKTIKGRPAEKAYNYILKMCQQHEVIPSFASSTVSKAPTIELDWDGSKYTATVTDTNNYLFDITGDNGVTIKKNGNEYTISTPYPLKNGTIIVANKHSNVPNDSLLVWTRDGYQVMCSGMGDPVHFVFKVKITKPTIEIEKTGATSADYAYRTFDILDEDGNFVKTITTDANGKGSGQLNGYGTFMIKERYTKNYDVTYSTTGGRSGDNGFYIFTFNKEDGATKKIDVVNKQKVGELQIFKSAQDIMSPGFTFSGFKFKVEGNGITRVGITDFMGMARFDSPAHLVTNWATAENDMVIEHRMTAGELLAHLNDANYTIVSGYDKTNSTFTKTLAAGDSIIVNYPCTIIDKNTSAFIANILFRGGVENTGTVADDKITNANLEEAKTYLGTFRNDVLQAGLSVEKFNQYDVNFDDAIDNADIQILTDAINNNGIIERNGAILPGGEYTVTELDVPGRYLAPSPVKVNVLPNDTTQVNVKNWLKSTGVKIVKLSEDGLVSGIRFHITGVTVSGASVNKYVTTGPDGTFLDKTIIAGTYKIEEALTTTNIYMPQPAQTVTISAEDTEPATVTFVNKLKTYPFKIVKTSENGIVDGISFVITGTNDRKELVSETVTTNAAGEAEINLYAGTYTITEILPDNYAYVEPKAMEIKIASDGVIFEVTENGNKLLEENTAKFENTIKEFKVNLVKTDSQTGAVPQGDATFAGAVYGLYDGDNLIESITTDENGAGSFTSELPYGDFNYYIKEITPPVGYQLNETEYLIDSDVDSAVDGKIITVDVSDTPIYGIFSLIKYYGTEANKKREDGAEFRIYLKSAGSYDAANEYERDYIVTNSSAEGGDESGGANVLGGEAHTKQLPYGIYVVEQVKGKENCTLSEPFEVNLTDKDANYSYSTELLNVLTPTLIKLKKMSAIDSEPLAGAEFELKGSEGNTIGTFITGDDGYTEEISLMPGTYIFSEIVSPVGYLLNNQEVSFTINEDGSVSGETEMKNAPIPTISTIAASDDGLKTVLLTKETKIVDTVKINNLVIGNEYTVKGSLIDKNDTQKTLATGEVTLTAESTNVEVKVPMIFDGTQLNVDSAVVFEELYYNDQLIASHKDITDEEQTVQFPDLKTTATFEQGIKTNAPKKDIVVIDEVSVKNILPNVTYKISGSLVNKDDPEKILATAETNFVSETTFGTAELKFTVDASTLEGKTIVAFEKLSFDGKDIAIHADINDKEQSVYVSKVRTKIANGLVDEKTKNITLTDVIMYENLTPGETYRVVGSLKYKDGTDVMSNNEPITATAVFVPKEKNGETEVTFEFNENDLNELTVVVFEEIYDVKTGTLIGEHKDLNDEDQTAIFTPDAPGTGDRTAISLYIALSGVSLVIIIGIAVYLLKRKNKASKDIH